MTHVSICHPTQVTAEDIPELNKLHFKNGMLWDTFLSLTNETDGSKCIIVKRNKSIVAWGLMFKGFTQSKFNLYIYTKPKQRRKGYGRLIVNTALSIHYPLRVRSHNWGNRQFFEQFHKDQIYIVQN